MVAIEAEPLELDDEYWRRDKNIKSLEVDLILLTFVAWDLILELLCLVEFGQTILKSCVVCGSLICHLCVSFLTC